MSDTEPHMGKTVRANSLLLGLFAAVTAGLIALTFQSTKVRIVESERLAAQKALSQIIPTQNHDNDLLETVISLTKKQALQLGHSEPVEINVATKSGKPVAYIFPAVAPDGYSGDIKLIIGINLDGTIAGVRALAHKETPGLGDKVDIKKSDWILSFDGKSLQKPKQERWKVKKDGGEFDQFTGATITPRAVVRQVKAALELYQSDANTILESFKLTAPTK